MLKVGRILIGRAAQPGRDVGQSQGNWPPTSSGDVWRRPGRRSADRRLAPGTRVVRGGRAEPAGVTRVSGAPSRVEHRRRRGCRAMPGAGSTNSTYTRSACLPSNGRPWRHRARSGGRRFTSSVTRQQFGHRQLGRAQRIEHACSGRLLLVVEEGSAHALGETPGARRRSSWRTWYQAFSQFRPCLEPPFIHSVMPP